jgi:hypothetical protein
MVLCQQGEAMNDLYEQQAALSDDTLRHMIKIAIADVTHMQEEIIKMQQELLRRERIEQNTLKEDVR